jgi:hypothetical protein
MKKGKLSRKEKKNNEILTLKRAHTIKNENYIRYIEREEKVN